MSSFWSGICEQSRLRPVSARHAENYASCSVTVSEVLSSVFRALLRFGSHPFRAQIAAFCISALSSSVFSLRWQRISAQDKTRLWPLYGYYTALMCAGSVFGAATWVSWMYSLEANINRENPGLPKDQDQLLRQRAQYWIAAWAPLYSIEILCLFLAQLLVLDRYNPGPSFTTASLFQTFRRRLIGVVKRGADTVPRKIAVAGRVVIAAVILCGVVGLCGNAYVSALRKERGDLHYAAATAIADNNMKAAEEFKKQALDKATLANQVVSIQQFCELLTLLIIIVVYMIVGVISTQILRAAFQGLDSLGYDRKTIADALAYGKDVLLRTRFTVVFVFLTFIMRAVYAIMNALPDLLQNVNAACAAQVSSPCDASCYNVWTLMGTWMFFTPGFRLGVESVSFPLTLLVALWAMTTKTVLQKMDASGVEIGSLVDRTGSRL